MTEGNYSNVGHRGPVYKGLGAMNPCDNLHLRYLSFTKQNKKKPYVIVGRLISTRWDNVIFQYFPEFPLFKGFCIAFLVLISIE
jgi:hypothetical protein